MARMNSANAATFAAVVKKAVIGVGAPSYTSGAHIWNGTAESLKASPAIRKTSPKIRPMPTPEVFTAAATPAKSTVPVKP